MYVHVRYSAGIWYSSRSTWNGSRYKVYLKVDIVCFANTYEMVKWIFYGFILRQWRHHTLFKRVYYEVFLTISKICIFQRLGGDRQKVYLKGLLLLEDTVKVVERFQEYCIVVAVTAQT